MSDAPKTTSALPHIVLASVFVIILLFVFFWPKSEKSASAPVEIKDIAPPAVAPPAAVEPIKEEPIGTLDEADIAPPVEEEVETPEEPIIEPPLDISDGAIKTAMLAVSEYPVLGKLLINDDLLNRFVVYVTNLAQHDIAPQHQLLTPPDRPFSTFQQAGKAWIDPASFKRYSPYVEAFESIEEQAMLDLLMQYQPAIEEAYAEIGEPNTSFREKLQQAIAHLLDTPSYPIPVEVYTDSVMFKFKNPALESLSMPQKQLLRMGPDNLRRFKQKLRAFSDAFDESE